jgi:hypothetical protein
MYSFRLQLRIDLQKKMFNNKYRFGTANSFLGRVERVSRVPRHPHTGTSRRDSPAEPLRRVSTQIFSFFYDFFYFKLKKIKLIDVW